jgi:hypothetical protein
MARKSRKKPSLLKMLDRYFHPSAGQIPVLFIDCSTIIDLERASWNPQLTKELGDPSYEVVGNTFSYIKDVSRNIVFTPGIFDEIYHHHKHVRINGRGEISDPLYHLVAANIENSDRILAEVDRYRESEVDVVIDLLERLKCANGVVNRGKKTLKDPISETDLKLLESVVSLAALSSQMAHDRLLKEGDSPEIIGSTYRIGVLSGDSHIYGTLLKFVNNDEMGIRYKDYLHAFNSRDFTLIDKP